MRVSSSLRKDREASSPCRLVYGSGLGDGRWPPRWQRTQPSCCSGLHGGSNDGWGSDEGLMGVSDWFKT